MEENRALVDLLAKGRSHVQELQTAATAFQPEDPTEAAMAHVSRPLSDAVPSTMCSCAPRRQC